MTDIAELVLDPRAQAAAVEGRSVVPGWPDETTVEVRLHEIVDQLDRLEGLRVFAADFDAYGCGYASFVEVKLTRADSSLTSLEDWGLETRGFGLLLNLLAPIAVLQDHAQESQQVDRDAGSSSLPGPEHLCRCPVPGFAESEPILDVLREHGYTVLDPEPLLQPIAPGLEPDTNLCGDELAVFDAWFYWSD